MKKSYKTSYYMGRSDKVNCKTTASSKDGCMVLSVYSRKSFQKSREEMEKTLKSVLQLEQKNLIPLVTSKAMIDEDGALSFQATVILEHSFCNYVMITELLWELKAMSYRFFIMMEQPTLSSAMEGAGMYGN